MGRIFIYLYLLLIPFFCNANTALREGLSTAKQGDYIVTAQNKSYTMLLVQTKEADIIKIEEITVPMTRVNLKGFDWSFWVKNDAPGNTCWVRYTINLRDASMTEFYSFTKKGYYKISEADNFLSKLLNLEMVPVADSQRKKVGPKPLVGGDNRKFWQPQMVFGGQCIPGVQFKAYRTQWPKDGTELSERSIEVYLPQDPVTYPAYFPYWLQVYGMVGKAKIRIVDSGRGLISPKPAVPQ